MKIGKEGEIAPSFIDQKGIGKVECFEWRAATQGHYRRELRLRMKPWKPNGHAGRCVRHVHTRLQGQGQREPGWAQSCPRVCQSHLKFQKNVGNSIRKTRSCKVNEKCATHPYTLMLWPCLSCNVSENWNKRNSIAWTGPCFARVMLENFLDNGSSPFDDKYGVWYKSKQCWHDSWT